MLSKMLVSSTPTVKQTLSFAVLSVFLVGGCKREETGTKALPAKLSPVTSPSRSPSPQTAATSWKTVEEFDYSWASGQPPVHFKLELPVGYEDPGDFTRIHIQSPGQPELVVDNQDGWIQSDSPLARSPVHKRLQAHNLVPSPYVLVLAVSEKPADPPIVILRSWGYASDPERLHLIGFQASGRPVLLFNNELDLVDFRDLDDDGCREIVGLPCLGQGLGSDLGTYAPVLVYKIPRGASGPAAVSDSLSASYNLERDYAWAGPACNPELAIVLHPPGGGKPVVMDAKKAQTLVQTTKP
jgi:hypothetical protein